jgi:hypothetical protein
MSVQVTALVGMMGNAVPGVELEPSGDGDHACRLVSLKRRV